MSEVRVTKWGRNRPTKPQSTPLRQEGLSGLYLANGQTHKTRTVIHLNLILS